MTVVAGTCASCAGRGWKFVHSRRALVARLLDDADDSASRRPCMDCGGTGRTQRRGDA